MSRVRRRIMHWMWDGRPEWTWKIDDLLDKVKIDLDDVVGRVTCAVWGHEPVPDNCGIPEHDFCVWCKKSMPRQAPRSGSWPAWPPRGSS